jgi:hypothetical protein
MHPSKFPSKLAVEYRDNSGTTQAVKRLHTILDDLPRINSDWVEESSKSDTVSLSAQVAKEEIKDETLRPKKIKKPGFFKRLWLRFIDYMKLPEEPDFDYEAVNKSPLNMGDMWDTFR